MNSKPSLLETVGRIIQRVRYGDIEDVYYDKYWHEASQVRRDEYLDFARLILKTILPHLSDESRAILEKELGQ